MKNKQTWKAVKIKFTLLADLTLVSVISSVSIDLSLL